MSTKLSSRGDSGNQEEESIDQIQCHRYHFVEGKGLSESNGDQVEQGQHRENNDEHVEVDQRWIASEGGSDHVADQRHDNCGKEQLESVRNAIPRSRASQVLTSTARRPSWSMFAIAIVVACRTVAIDYTAEKKCGVEGTGLNVDPKRCVVLGRKHKETAGDALKDEQNASRSDV